MGTDKRERQKTARFEKIVAEQAAAKKARTRRTAIRGVIALAVIVAAVFAVSTFFGDDDDDETETTSDTTLPEQEEPKCDSEIVAAAVGRPAPDTEPPPEDTAPDALESTTLVEGTGDGAVAGDAVVVHYVGKMADGTIFDCSWNPEGTGEPFPVTLGQGGVIAGWDQGLIGAKAGERRHLVIGSENAYGPAGNQGIPPDAPLSFDVDILEVQKAGTATTLPVDPTATTLPLDPTATTTPTSQP